MAGVPRRPGTRPVPRTAPAARSAPGVGRGSTAAASNGLCRLSSALQSRVAVAAGAEGVGGVSGPHEESAGHAHAEDMDQKAVEYDRERTWSTHGRGEGHDNQVHGEVHDDSI